MYSLLKDIKHIIYHISPEIINLNIQHSLAKAQVKWIVNKTDPSVTIAGFKIIKGRLGLLRA